MPLRLSELRSLSPLKLWTKAAPELPPADAVLGAALEPAPVSASAPTFGACAPSPLADGEDPPGDLKGTRILRGCIPRAELTARRPATPSGDAPIRMAWPRVTW